MLAKYILVAFAVAFLVAAAASYVRAGQWKASARTWLLVAAIFGAVSAWLHYAVSAS